MFARTQHLLLRPAWDEDRTALETLAATERNVRDLFGAPEGEHPLATCAIEQGGSGASLPKLLVFRRTTAAPELVGVAGLTRTGGGAVELVCWIARAHRGLGYGREAMDATLAMARQSLRLRSVRVGKLAGSSRSFARPVRADGGWIDSGADDLAARSDAQAA